MAKTIKWLLTSIRLDSYTLLKQATEKSIQRPQSGKDTNKIKNPITKTESPTPPGSLPNQSPRSTPQSHVLRNMGCKKSWQGQKSVELHTCIFAHISFELCPCYVVFICVYILLSALWQATHTDPNGLQSAWTGSVHRHQERKRIDEGVAVISHTSVIKLQHAKTWLRD